jgi:hypothetical protein
MIKKYIPIPRWKPVSYVRPPYPSEIKKEGRAEKAEKAEKEPLALKPDEMIKIYAKEIYGIPIDSYERVKLIKAVRTVLGITDRSKLVEKGKRVENFELFKKERFNRADPWGVQINGILKEGSSAYKYLKMYSLTVYGSLMIERINKYKGEFTVYAITKGSKKFQAMGASNHIRLPEDFPLLSIYPFTGQKIDPLAVIHHEFEHTVFGGSDFDIGSLQEEVSAVVNYENPVRVLNDYEPRYVYYQRDTNLTVSVFDSTNIMEGGRTYDPADPRILK